MAADNEALINIEYFRHTNFSVNQLIFSNHPLIEKYKAQYMNEDGLNYLARIMQRSVLYRDYIIDQLAAYNMPLQLMFLPVIESGYSETAISKSGAVGVWQFMRNSVAGYDIHISDWLDERRDPWKTTLAAVKKLKYNYDNLGDWCLALAAYNAGLNAIRQAIQRSGSHDFWYLLENGYLKQETALYVPKFLAITEILMQSYELGIDWGMIENAMTTAVVDVKQCVDINVIEKELQLDKDLLARLNPALTYSITPPDIAYGLRIPSEYTTQLQLLLASGKILISYYTYVIQSGDTLYALSNHYGISVKSIQQANHNLNPKALQVGQRIIIPALKKVGPYTKKTKSSGRFTQTYTVHKGDTLWSIALAHDTTVETLAEQNKLQITSVLKIGQILLVP